VVRESGFGQVDVYPDPVDSFWSIDDASYRSRAFGACDGVDRGERPVRPGAHQASLIESGSA
jgi:hypothetical protein